MATDMNVFQSDTFIILILTNMTLMKCLHFKDKYLYTAQFSAAVDVMFICLLFHTLHSKTYLKADCDCISTNAPSATGVLGEKCVEAILAL
jgi:hypothetical protein